MLYGEKVKWRNFKMVDYMSYDSDHRLLKGTMNYKSEATKYKTYLRQRTTPPIELFPLVSIDGPSEIDKHLRDVKDSVEKTVKQEGKDRSWISNEAFDIIK